MCLGVPGKVITIEDHEGQPVGKVNFAGIVRDVGLAFVPEARPGDYVIVHVGYAISLLDEAAAFETLTLLQDLEKCGEEGNL